MIAFVLVALLEVTDIRSGAFAVDGDGPGVAFFVESYELMLDQDGSDCPKANQSLYDVLFRHYRLEARPSPNDRSVRKWEAPKLVVKDNVEQTRKMLADLAECGQSNEAVRQALDQSGEGILKSPAFLNSSAVITQFDKETGGVYLTVAKRMDAAPQAPTEEPVNHDQSPDSAISPTSPGAADLKATVQAAFHDLSSTGIWLFGAIGSLTVLLLFALLLSVFSLLRRLDRLRVERYKGLSTELAPQWKKTLEVLQDQHQAMDNINTLLYARLGPRPKSRVDVPIQESRAHAQGGRRGPEAISRASSVGSSATGERRSQAVLPTRLDHRFTIGDLIGRYNAAVQAGKIDALMLEIGPCRWVLAMDDRRLAVVAEAPTGRVVLDFLYLEDIEGRGILLPGPSFVAQRTAYGGKEGLGRALSPVYQWASGADFVVKEAALAAPTPDGTTIDVLKPGRIEL